MPADLGELQVRIAYHFREPELLVRALTHSSCAHEQGDVTAANERLEFLGDAVLDLLVSELLMERDSEADEGVLSRSRAAAVNTDALADRARALELGRWVRLGRGERLSGGPDKASILANVFEALLGAVYLDGGLEPARSLVRRELLPELAALDAAAGDAKTRLQEWLQRRGRPVPHYETVAERGPDHRKEFEVEVSVGAQVLASGVGRSKRSAEQGAAQRALAALERDDP